MRGARLAGALALAALLAAGCSSSDEPDAAVDDTSGETTMTTVPYEPHVPDDVEPPPVEGNGVVVPQPAAAVPEGYELEELFVGGTATSFDAVDEPNDGQWTATPGEEAAYRTRVIVRRPERPEDFSGTVLIDWFNVSALEAAPDWTFLSDEIAREGHAYIGVSAQSQGIEGGETLLDVEVDEQQAADAGVSADGSGLKATDPERYGTLVHPGDAFSYDIFSQVGRVAQSTPDLLLGDLQPTQVLAVGESQSAGFLTTLINAVHPLDPVFDGFLVHSRASVAPPLDGDYARIRQAVASDDPAAVAVRIRTDLDEPVLIYVTESDLTALGYAHARQPDTDLLRTWEVAGTAHADAHLIRAIVGGPRDPAVGDLLGCGPINTGPQMETLTAAFHHLVAWVADGALPPSGTPIELSDGDEVVIARDDRGNALGGVRNPLVDVPVATLSGDPPDGTSLAGGDVCALFGSTTPFDQPTLVDLYGTADAYLEQFGASAAEQVTNGFLLQPDADALIAEAEANRSLFD
jgi:hypothetical protein